MPCGPRRAPRRARAARSSRGRRRPAPAPRSGARLAQDPEYPVRAGATGPAMRGRRSALRRAAVAALLAGPRAGEASLTRSSRAPPWSLRIEDEAPLTVVAMIRGDAWVVTAREAPMTLGRGDVAILRGPEPYTFADDPSTPPQAIVGPGQRCTTPGGEPLDERWKRGVRSWGNSPDGATVLVTGTYQIDSAVSRRLLRALPGLLVLRERDWDSPLVPLLAGEVVREEPG